MTKPADLCCYPLPSGRTCRQITLKGEYLCRHHRRLYNKTEAETAHEEAMERLADKLNSLAFPDLLHALYGKLSRIRAIVRSHPEAQLALEITLHRLREEMALASHPTEADHPLPTPMNFPENLMESIMRSGLDFLKTQ